MNIIQCAHASLLALCLSPCAPAEASDRHASSPLSAIRHAGESAAQARQRAFRAAIHVPAPYPSPGNVAVLADVSGIAGVSAAVIPWQASAGDFQSEVFSTARDRFLDWQLQDVPGLVKRRPSWRYPHDGCFARAETFNRNLAAGHSQRKLQKIYVFGDLATHTDNAADSMVRWWYHVAPVTRIGNEVFVVDPALSSDHPVALEQWLQQVVNATPDPLAERAKLTIAVCDAASFAPYEQLCNGSDGYDPERVEDYVRLYLDREWDNEIMLGRDPIETLLDD